MEAPTAGTAEIYKIMHGYTYTGDDSWDWWAWIEANEKDLDDINYVTYILHPSFLNPVRDVKEPGTKFLIKARGWGTFMLNANVHLKSGKDVKLAHELALEYPDSNMELLAEISLSGSRDKQVIQLLFGDLTALPKKHAADILVVSAIRGDYIPVKNSLVHALFSKGIDVAGMARNKEIDLVDKLNCWLSKPLTLEKQDEMNFKRILCFELQPGAEAREFVNNIFRCINTFSFDFDNKIVAMPVVATGSQGATIENMLPAILDSGIFWMENGLPLDCIKLVIHGEEKIAQARAVFLKSKEQYESKKSLETASATGDQTYNLPGDKRGLKVTGQTAIPVTGSEIKSSVSKKDTGQFSDHANGVINQHEPPISSVGEQYDYYISYAHAQEDAVKIFVAALQEKDKSKKIIFDKSTVTAGASWLRQISENIEKSKQFICILSPQYSASKICWDEFQVAKLKEYSTNRSVIKVIYFLKDIKLPLIMAMYSYIDCTEGNLQKLRDSVKYL